MPIFRNGLPELRAALRQCGRIDLRRDDRVGCAQRVRADVQFARMRSDGGRFYGFLL